MSEAFEQFTISFLQRIAKGKQVEYSEPLKSFIVHRNNWFMRTIPVFLIMEAWEMRT